MLRFFNSQNLAFKKDALDNIEQFNSVCIDISAIEGLLTSYDRKLYRNVTENFNTQLENYMNGHINNYHFIDYLSSATGILCKIKDRYLHYFQRFDKPEYQYKPLG